jgi:hypothetical protein
LAETLKRHEVFHWATNLTCRRNSMPHRALPVAVRQLSAWLEICAGCGKVRTVSGFLPSGSRSINPPCVDSCLKLDNSRSWRLALGRRRPRGFSCPRPTPSLIGIDAFSRFHLGKKKKQHNSCRLFHFARTIYSQGPLGIVRRGCLCFASRTANRPQVV